ncbi:558_t:CDS:2, partial [Entrophospora sp. SA101]
ESYVVPHLINKGILSSLHPIINFCISGDDRNVGHKIKHVMITTAILDDKEHLSYPDYHYAMYIGALSCI